MLDSPFPPLRREFAARTVGWRRPGGRELPWFWCGLRCEQDSSGRRVRALFNDRVQLRTHLAGLLRAADERAAAKDLALSALGEAVAFVPAVGPIASADPVPSGPNSGLTGGCL